MNISIFYIATMLVFGGLLFILISLVKIKYKSITIEAIEGNDRYFFVIGIFLLFFGIYLTVIDSGSTLPTQKEVTPSIKINYDSDTAHIVENITGTAKNIPERHELWILVYAYPAHKYYPISKADVQDGEWSVPVYIGINDNVGYKFDIMAVLADQEARAKLASYVIKCKQNNDWPGLYRIPDGVQVYDKIIVVREPAEAPTSMHVQIPTPTSTKAPDLHQIFTDIISILGLFVAIYGAYITHQEHKEKRRRSTKQRRP